MGGRDVKDYINNLDDNKENNDQKVDEQEIQILNTILGDNDNNYQLIDILNQSEKVNRLVKYIGKGINKQTSHHGLDMYINFAKGIMQLGDAYRLYGVDINIAIDKKRKNLMDKGVYPDLSQENKNTFIEIMKRIDNNQLSQFSQEDQYMLEEIKSGKSDLLYALSFYGPFQEIFLTIFKEINSRKFDSYDYSNLEDYKSSPNAIGIRDLKNIYDKATGGKSLEIQAQKDKIDQRGDNLYDNIAEFVQSPDKLNKMSPADMDKWSGQVLSLRNESTRKSFVERYKKYIQDKIKKIEGQLYAHKESKNTTYNGKKEEYKMQLAILKGDKEKLDITNKKEGIESIITTIDILLHGASVDAMLTEIPSLTVDAILGQEGKVVSTEYAKTLNTAFHLNKTEYDKILAACNGTDANAKANAQVMVLAYAQLMAKGNDAYSKALEGVTADMVTVEGDIFVFQKNGIKVVVGESPLRVSFGQDEVKEGYDIKMAQGTPHTFKSLAKEAKGKGVDWVKEMLFAKDPLTGDSKVATEITKDKNGKPQMQNYANFSDAFSAFFDSDMWDQIKVLFLSLGAATTEKEGEKEDKQLDINYINEKSKFRKIEFAPDTTKPNEKVNYGKILSQYEPTKKSSDGTNYKERFVLASNEIRRQYIETCYRDKKRDNAYALLKPTSTPIKENNGVGESSKAPEGKKFESGKPIPDLKIKADANPAYEGKVDLKDQTSDNPYLTVDGQAIALLKQDDHYEGVMGVFSGGKFVEKHVVFSLDFKNITINSEEMKGLNENKNNFYESKFYSNNIYKFDEIIKEKKGPSSFFPLFLMHACQEFPKEDNKVSAIYKQVNDKLSSALPDVQKIFVELQRDLANQYISTDLLNKQGIKQSIDTAKDKLLAIKGSDGVVVLQSQVDERYKQFSVLNP